jgi:hypothetical protein
VVRDFEEGVRSKIEDWYEGRQVDLWQVVCGDEWSTIYCDSLVEWISIRLSVFGTEKGLFLPSWFVGHF